MAAAPDTREQFFAQPTAGVPPELESETWQVFIDMLTKLCSVLGELNRDQYYRILDVAAHLAAGSADAPYIGSNGNWWVGGTDTGVSALPPYIGPNGHWWVGQTDTGVSATGPPGPAGPPGPQGTGLKILGVYPDLPSLVAAHPTGNPGDAYMVGTGPNYNLFIWDTATNSWKDAGPITAGIADAPATASQPYVRNGLTNTWQLLSPIDGGTF